MIPALLEQDNPTFSVSVQAALRILTTNFCSLIPVIDLSTAVYSVVDIGIFYAPTTTQLLWEPVGGGDSLPSSDPYAHLLSYLVKKVRIY